MFASQHTHNNTIVLFLRWVRALFKWQLLNKEKNLKKKNPTITYQNILIFTKAVLESEMIDSCETQDSLNLTAEMPNKE